MQQMADIVQKGGGNQGVAGTGLLCVPSRLQRMLGLADRLAEVGSIASFLEKPEDRADRIFVGHLSLRGLLMFSVEESAARGQNDDGLERPHPRSHRDGGGNRPYGRSTVLTH